ncbi:MAG: RNA polymerase sigma factor [Gaiellaceae bacterium]
MAFPVPPFETFYATHRAEVFRFLARRLGRQGAEDAFQETFLKALRAYPRLEHGVHLRAWALTIASRVVLDDVRKRSATRPSHLTELLDVETQDGRPAFEELAPFTDDLPSKERAAVVLRYGYDLGYDEIGAALGSSEAAARQAASAGVRRLRKELS